MRTRSSETRSLILCLGLVAWSMAGPIAAAQAAEDPAVLVQQAKNLRLAGDDEGAYKLYVRAHNLANSPETAAHLGMAEINLALWVDAETHLREALKRPNDPFIARNRVPIVEQLKMVRTHLGMLEVVGRPSGAEVEVGGKPVGRLPLPGPLRVPTGELNVRVAAEGHRVERRDVDIQTGQLHRITVELDPLPPGGVAGAPPVAGAASGYVPSEGALRAREGSGRPLPEAGARADWKRTGAWVSAAAGVALAGTGVFTVLAHDSDIRQFNDYMAPAVTTADHKCATEAPDKGGSYCRKLLDHADAMKRWAYISFGGAAVAGVAAVILFANSSPSETASAPPASHLALSCVPTVLGATGASCAVRF
jgi:hypothetical protein